METLKWLVVTAMVIIIGKWIGRWLWPEDWEDFDNRNN
jgi:hypothetical protein